MGFLPEIPLGKKNPITYHFKPLYMIKGVTDALKTPFVLHGGRLAWEGESFFLSVCYLFKALHMNN